MTIVQASKLFIASISMFFCACTETNTSDYSLEGSDSIKSELLLENSDDSNPFKLETSKFELWEIDFDKDGDLDEIFSHAFLNGDSLYVFKNTGKNYELSLNTINFSQDGLYEVDSICAAIDTSLASFVIYTHFLHLYCISVIRFRIVQDTSVLINTL